MNYQQLKELYDNHVIPSYGRSPVAFAKGNGCTLYDLDGKAYIDFGAGIGVNSVGYAHPKWVAAVAEQAGTLAHVSNLYHTVPGALLAKRLTGLAGMKSAFFANSGAEANEGLFKLARKYSSDKYGENRAVIVTLVNSFHGRTLSTLAATGQEKFHKHFHPFPQGFRYVHSGDLAALEAQPDDVCAVLVEPVQGEGGVLPQDAGYLAAVQALCQKRGWLLLVDEVQTGIGRCGAWFAYQKLGITPDAVSFAKGIAGGLPMGGFLAGERCADTLGPGTHATTFGANPICCAAALVTLDILAEALPFVEEKGRLLCDLLAGAPHVAQIRGLGLMLGIKVEGVNPGDVVAKALERGLVCLTAGEGIVRLLPPLVIGDEDLRAGAAILKGILEEL